jgi:hypothetical protein
MKIATPPGARRHRRGADSPKSGGGGPRRGRHVTRKPPAQVIIYLKREGRMGAILHEIIIFAAKSRSYHITE